MKRVHYVTALLTCVSCLAACGSTHRSYASNDAGDTGIDTATVQGFICVGEAGLIMSSVDGAQWSPVPRVTDADLKSIAFGNSRIVVVGNDGTVLTSDDAVEWTVRDSGVEYSFFAVIFEAGRFLAVGGGWGTGTTAATSPDGVAWQPFHSLDYSLHTFVHGDGKIVGTGSRGGGDAGMQHAVFASIGGAPWTPSSAPVFEGGYYDNGAFNVLAADRTIHVSDDAERWIQVGSVEATTGLFDIARANGTYFIGGEFGHIYTSEDLTTWDTHTLSANDYFAAVAYGASTWVAAGSAIATSRDGTSWELVDIPERLGIQDAIYIGATE